MERPTQRDRVLTMLETQGWVSIPMFLTAGITRFGARIFELRKQGYEIISREEHKGHSRHVWYKLVLPKGQQNLFTYGTLSNEQNTKEPSHESPHV